MPVATPWNESVSEEPEGPASEPSRPTEPRAWPKPAAPMRDTLRTLNEEDFDFHDTIPAPPWSDEVSDSDLPPLPAR